MQTSLLNFPEYSRKEPAIELADNIRNYWLAEGWRGIRVEAKANSAHPEAQWYIKSNVGANGMPPGGRSEPIDHLRGGWRI